MKINCQIIEDLLPLYVDNVCSNESKQAVEKHLQECESCRKMIESTQSLCVPHIEPDRPAADQAVKKGFRKIRLRWWAAILTIIALIPVAFLGWNEYNGQGVAFSNQKELLQGNAFMGCLVEGDYAKAYTYLDIEGKKHDWLSTWFEEEELVNLKADGLEKFCKLGEKVETLGGIESYEYVGVSICGVNYHGDKVHRITYSIKYNGKDQLFHVDVSNAGVTGFISNGSFVTDPLAQLCIWSEYLWQDYQGCYYDPEHREYVYYDQDNDSK